MTMNKALGQLAREGFLVRRKKSGTQVAQPRAESAVVAIADIRDEVRRSGRAYRFHLIARRMRPGREEDALLLGAPGTGEVLWLQGLHLADDRPFCLETRLINPPSPRAPRTRTSPRWRPAPGCSTPCPGAWRATASGR